MKYWQSSLLISAMLLSIVPCQSDAQKPSPIVLNPQTCGDFLTRWGDKPAVLKFVRCEQVKNPQVDRLVSSYLVTGAEAAAVEKLLRKKFGMAPLRFVCCGWEPSPIQGESVPRYGHHVDKDGFRFEVSMASGETLINARDDWSEIPEFHVRVKTYLGEV